NGKGGSRPEKGGQKAQQYAIDSPVKESEFSHNEKSQGHENEEKEASVTQKEETIVIKGVTIKVLSDVVEINGKKFKVQQSDIDFLKKAKDIAEAITINDHEIILKVLNYKKTIPLKEI
ncbi:MAG: hypothetical protein QXP90_00005, partial [Metallosphaera sp.]|uniref:hypothetical protein n=1 Tax=Metallosphaera sp. TaxID=2020860 RepID=UPI00317CFC01